MTNLLEQGRNQGETIDHQKNLALIYKKIIDADHSL